jgi:2-methoxy-6-polyprenyl-1,4-benzoquinol methylase
MRALSRFGRSSSRARVAEYRAFDGENTRLSPLSNATIRRKTRRARPREDERAGMALRVFASRCARGAARVSSARAFATSPSTTADEPPTTADEASTSSTHRGEAKTASFGYVEVDAREKESLVRGVFERVAPSYDVMNDLMSAGVHRLWKDYFVSKVGVFAGMTHLDVAGGTGDIAFRVLRALQRVEREAELDGQVLDANTRGKVVVSDINPAMLREGMKRATQRGLNQEQLTWLEGNAEKLPVEDESVDVYTIAFGLRNVTDTRAAIADAYRCLKPGGKYMILEFSHVENEILKQMYDFYSFNVIPKLGELVARDRGSYQYLVESIRKFPPQEKLKSMMRDVGFKHVSHENLTGGMVAVHTGYKTKDRI